MLNLLRHPLPGVMLCAPPARNALPPAFLWSHPWQGGHIHPSWGLQPSCGVTSCLLPAGRAAGLQESLGPS